VKTGCKAFCSRVPRRSCGRRRFCAGERRLRRRVGFAGAGFEGVVPEATGRPAYHPATRLKIYLYGYLNRIQPSRRLERQTQRNIELRWLTPDFKTIADFRRDSGPAIRAACARFIVLCRQFKLFTRAIVAIDGSKFKAVNNRDKNFTVAKVAKRIEQVEASIARYLAALDRADREEAMWLRQRQSFALAKA
jgi:transposase